jgi:hypothetical protein
LYSPLSFLNTILIDYSKKYKIDYEKLTFNFVYEKQDKVLNEKGRKIYGLFIEGADWDTTNKILK